MAIVGVSGSPIPGGNADRIVHSLLERSGHEHTFVNQAKDFVTLKERIQHRGHMSSHELQARLDTARGEHASKHRYGHVITNDVLEDAFKQLKQIIEDSRPT